MSWAREEWKEGLNQKALNKIIEIENQNEKLKKETKQKQFQLDSLEAAFNKQKRQCESDKSEISILKRENHTLGETCSKLEHKSEKLCNELRHKESYLNSIESQLQRCKSQLDQSNSKHVKNDNNDHNATALLSKLKEVELELAQEKSKNEELEKELKDSKTPKVSNPQQSYKSALPWAIDYVSPKKENRQPTFDLLSGSPAAFGAGDTGSVPLLSDLKLPLLPISNNIEVENLKAELNASAKCNKEMEAKLNDELKEARSKLLDKEKTIQKKTDEVVKYQMQVEQVNIKARWTIDVAL
ncbi:uncharacterized protein LOC143461523 [Clavelina lepadiformis]|uniref:uncharacterized protein LOC143461523 n=1 Tax=Clavelina lepadiformis TaxID=159417 RepID=UPI0040429329